MRLGIYDSLTYELSEFAKNSQVEYVYSLDRFEQKVVYTSSIQFANAIGTEVVAEYIENEKVLATMQNLAAHMVQGYYFSPPTPDITETCYPVNSPAQPINANKNISQATDYIL